VTQPERTWKVVSMISLRSASILVHRDWSVATGLSWTSTVRRMGPLLVPQRTMADQGERIPRKPVSLPRLSPMSSSRVTSSPTGVQ
jgi:hypothetical protein